MADLENDYQIESEFSPVTTRVGSVVHALMIFSDGRAACGMRSKGWMVARSRDALDCPACVAAAYFDVRKKPKKRKTSRKRVR